MSSLERDGHGPHGAVAPVNRREEFALHLFDRLWEGYRSRVPYAATYEAVVRRAGGAFLNDHIAFRTIAAQQPATGIATVSRVAEALGYRGAGWYQFESQRLSAAHYQHPNPGFPKLFISELRSWELSAGAREIIKRSLSTYGGPLPDETLAALAGLSDPGSPPLGSLLDQLVDYFTSLPWGLPERSDVEALDAESQYGAWVLVHGNNVNHFTALVNSHGVQELDGIEKTVDALREAGVPMKTEIEGEPGSPLRQTATEAVIVDVPVTHHGQPAVTARPYAYFEIAERGQVLDSAGGRTRFEGFLGPQAANLFQMTRTQGR